MTLRNILHKTATVTCRECRKEPHKREQEQIPRANDGVIDAQSYMNRMILRKG